MTTEWIDESGVYETSVPLFVIDVGRRLQSVVDGRRAQRVNDERLESLTQACQGVLRSYLLEMGIEAPEEWWTIEIMRSKEDPSKLHVFARHPFTQEATPLWVLEETIATLAAEAWSRHR